MNSKQRISALLRGELPDRVGRVEAPWPETRARWKAEGLPADVHANDYFQLDIRYNLKFDSSFGLETQILEDGEDFQIVRTADGAVVKAWKRTGVPHTISYGITSAEDWQRLQPRLAVSRERFAFGYYGDYGYEYANPPFELVQRAYRNAALQSTFLALMMSEPFEDFLNKVGDEMLLMFLATEPELVTRMFTAHTDFLIAMIDLAAAEGFAFDAIFVGGDLAYKNGLLFSPQMYRDLLMPHHKRLFAHAHNVHRVPVIYHTDGDCRKAIPLLIESGIDCLQPLEVRAGMDVRELAPQYGDRLAFMGNISIENLARGGEAMRREITDKVSFMARNRYRYIYHSDHSLPGQVSLENFRQAMQLLDEYGNY